MRYSQAEYLPNQARPGTVLVMFAVCLIVLMGLVALVIDGGLLRAEQVRAQAIADAAARAGACQLYREYPTDQGNDSNGLAAAAACAIAADHGYVNDGTNSTVVVNVPPKSGPYAGVAGYIEVLVTSKQDRYFSNVWSSDPLYIRTRAVARGAWVSFSASILLLDLDDKGAVSVKGGGSLTCVGAPTYINSNSASALSVSGGGTVVVPSANITGDYSGNGVTGTITTGVHPMPDPLAYLPAPGETGAPPVPSTGSVVKTTPGGNNQYDLYPGTYTDLPNFGNGDKVVFHQASSNGNGGIYYITSGGLNSSGAQIVMAAGETGGLLIYLAGTGSGNTINLTGNANSSVTLGPRTDGPYAGLVLFQSRLLTGDLTIASNGDFNVSGTIYAPAARLHITGNGSASSIGSQWIGRNLYLAGNGSININYTNTAVARTRIIALVE